MNPEPIFKAKIAGVAFGFCFIKGGKLVYSLITELVDAAVSGRTEQEIHVRTEIDAPFHFVAYVETQRSDYRHINVVVAVVAVLDYVVGFIHNFSVFVFAWNPEARCISEIAASRLEEYARLDGYEIADVYVGHNTQIKTPACPKNFVPKIIYVVLDGGIGRVYSYSYSPLSKKPVRSGCVKKFCADTGSTAETAMTELMICFICFISEIEFMMQR